MRCISVASHKREVFERDAEDVGYLWHFREPIVNTPELVEGAGNRVRKLVLDGVT
jgi:hypothetical protein